MYELTYIINPNLSENELAAQVDKVRGFIDQAGGKVKDEKILEKKRLAYPIKKQNFGFYVTINFEMLPENVAELERQIRFEPQILRHLLIAEEMVRKTYRVPSSRQPKAKPTEIFKRPISEAASKKIEIEEIDKKLEELLEN